MSAAYRAVMVSWGIAMMNGVLNQSRSAGEAPVQGRSGGVTREVVERHAVQRPVIGSLVTCLVRRGAEILQHEHAHRAGSPAAMAGGLDPAHQMVHVPALTDADLG